MKNVDKARYKLELMPKLVEDIIYKSQFKGKPKGIGVLFTTAIQRPLIEFFGSLTYFVSH